MLNQSRCGSMFLMSKCWRYQNEAGKVIDRPRFPSTALRFLRNETKLTKSSGAPDRSSATLLFIRVRPQSYIPLWVKTSWHELTDIPSQCLHHQTRTYPSWIVGMQRTHLGGFWRQPTQRRFSSWVDRGRSYSSPLLQSVRIKC